ncbi:MAG: hypothetical protein JKX74_05430 [Flavobacteriales bacterium]|nr:hypothetical protein [Flavobacteriales bacterium]
MIVDLTNTKSKIVNLPPLKVGDMSRRKPDIAKMKTLIDRQIMPIEEGLGKIIENPRFILE